ncbi:molybdopterin-dependent oxidoreductase [Thermococcus argininiproducens]|uniref:Molybdopterin-dependent oxidoreductase n=1 Tax=Thermococcus argininiproducens TaxID=2866384 RepID=A0A9E7MBV2_9EURY|nr:molybdopterin-dependent oxidoreductase [Thermococcus argininiproducens]USH00382.1 molybdopterin-dependent oxidoreductase [Thermococcus argininiproducens]
MEKKLIVAAFFIAILAIFTLLRLDSEPKVDQVSEKEIFQNSSYEQPSPILGENTSQEVGEWVIEVTGLVERPMNITLSQLKDMPQTLVFSELYCVGYPGKARKQGLWKGVKLSYILERAGVKENAIKIAFYAQDGFMTDLPVDEPFKNEEIIIAYEFNNESIEPRLVAPDMWGYKWIKYLIRIELVDYNFLGTYESEGYPDDAYIGERS